MIKGRARQKRDGAPWRGLGALSLAAALLLTFPAAMGAAAEERPPNIVFFIADDMYPEMFNALTEGEDLYLTPNLDRLAAEGTLMANQTVASPVCTPSRYNCLTGEYASRARNEAFRRRTEREGGQTVIQWNTFVTEGQAILPRHLKELGYVTGMVGKNHVIEVKGREAFDDYWGDPRSPENEAKLLANYQKVQEAVRGAGFDYAESLYDDNPNFIGLGELAVQNMDWIAEAGIEFIRGHADGPFFLYFATTIPHAPTQPERSWQADPLITAKGYLEEPPEGLPARESLGERVNAAGAKGRNAEIVLWLDDALGALLEALEASGQLDNTIIFFFNDHGQYAKGTLYQGGTMSPSIVWRQGGFPVGSRCETRVQNIDFAPTILDFAGGSPDGMGFDGVSFKPLLEGDETAGRDSHYYELGYARAVVKDGYKYVAVRYPDYAESRTLEERAEVLEAYNATRRRRKMQVVNEDPAAPYSHFSIVPGGQSAEHQSYGKAPAFFERDQLYDLAADPSERNNLYADPAYRATREALRAELQRYIDELPGSFDL